MVGVARVIEVTIEVTCQDTWPLGITPASDSYHSMRGRGDLGSDTYRLDGVRQARDEVSVTND